VDIFDDCGADIVDKFPRFKCKFSLTKGRFFQRPLRNPKKNILASLELQKLVTDGRFPWTHSSEPGISEAFHSENVLP
jgi:hypothetical protein